MAPCDAMAEIARLTEALRIMTLAKESCDVTLAANAEYQAQLNSALRERDTHLTERMAAQLLENQKLQIELDLHKLAVEWCTKYGVVIEDGKVCRICQISGVAYQVEPPAEFAEIISGRQA